MRLSYVRYLPLQNKAQEPFDKAVGRYQHAAEEVLNQEQIPQLYRDQIKQYFWRLAWSKARNGNTGQYGCKQVEHFRADFQQVREEIADSSSVTLKWWRDFSSVSCAGDTRC
jgi:hypothetical protein